MHWGSLLMPLADPYIEAPAKEDHRPPVAPFITITMTTIKLPTAEGHEIELDVADHAKLSAWPDLDLSCIHVVGDDALHALKPSTGKLHALSLEEMLRVRLKPCNRCNRDLPETVFPTSRTSPGYRNTCTACRSARRREQRSAGVTPVAVPVPGPPGNLLKRYRGKMAPNPERVWVTVDGERRDVPQVQAHDHATRVPLSTPEREFVGFVRLDTAAYKLLVSPWINADKWLWVLQSNGHVTTRAETYAKSLSIWRVTTLMEHHGIKSALSIEHTAYSA